MMTSPVVAPAINKHLRLALIWAIIGGLSVAALFPYLLSAMPALIDKIKLPLPLFVVAQVAQISIFLLLGSWLGLRLGQSVGLDSRLTRALVYQAHLPTVSLRALGMAVLAGVAVAIVMMSLALLFQRYMPAAAATQISMKLWKRLLASFYGGITEELLTRLFVMTTLVWLIWKLAFKSYIKPPAIAFWIAIMLAAILFGVGHLPAAAAIATLTPSYVLYISRT
jgi:hypothetical protein